MCTIGSIFLVSWGSTNWFKELMLFMLRTPFAWDKLMIKSLLLFPVHILFWTILFFILSAIVETLLKLSYKRLSGS
jgi:hypothetical protein